jgi:16S rRNA (uracil1498-N3)-methyltransferase
MKEGSCFAARDATGAFWDITIAAIDKGECRLACKRAGAEPASVTDSLPSYRGPFPEIHLYQCLCKGKKMEQIIRQTTELGVTRIIPVSSEYCVVDISGKEEDRRNKYGAVAKEALQQCGSSIMTEVAEPIDISMIVSEWDNRGLAMVLHQVAVDNQSSLSDLLESHAKSHPRTPVALVVGSEGGFSEKEVDLLVAGGFYPVLLKTNILRAETAAVVSVALTQQLLVNHL